MSPVPPTFMYKVTDCQETTPAWNLDGLCTMTQANRGVLQKLITVDQQMQIRLDGLIDKGIHGR
jgi:hypothetical protein